MDALLPIKRQARAYEAAVNSNGFGAQYRLYEVQNGNHIESYLSFLSAARRDPAACAEGLRPSRRRRRVERAAAVQPMHCDGRHNFAESIATGPLRQPVCALATSDAGAFEGAVIALPDRHAVRRLRLGSANTQMPARCYSNVLIGAPGRLVTRSHDGQSARRTSAFAWYRVIRRQEHPSHQRGTHAGTRPTMPSSAHVLHASSCLEGRGLMQQVERYAHRAPPSRDSRIMRKAPRAARVTGKAP